MELNVGLQSDHEPTETPTSGTAPNQAAADEMDCDEPDPEWTPGTYWLPVFFGRGHGK